MTGPPVKNYEAAIAKGIEDLKAVGLSAAAERAGCELRGESVVVPFLEQELKVRDHGREILGLDGPVSLVVHILALHYLVTADGSPMEDTLISFREVPGGRFYDAVYVANSITPLTRTFGNDEARFLKAGASLSGHAVESSGSALRFDAFPRVPVTVSYWPGEEMMPPGAAITFDASVTNYLPVEDIAVLGETLAHRLVTAGGGKGAGVYG